ncbi:MAG: thymidine phosphorylase [Myxococcota bacterium]|nr:thymidine phosphorylase [Myxococcota bacterium]
MVHAAALIEKKREGGALSRVEIEMLFAAYLGGDVTDYQMSALLMAIFFQGMLPEELSVWTEAMIASGDRLSFAAGAPLVDKHSTGGVGDKISLPLAPLLSACGLRVPMISGRGLGHTGGTLDKLESIPGFQTRFDGPSFRALIEEKRAAIIGQSERLVPMDKRLYGLRDVTGTVPSIPLIASSIMSKKIAEGAEHLLLDVKVGEGAFMKTQESALELAKTCATLGASMGQKVTALLTNMRAPLGVMVGNALEVKESIEILKGGGPADTRALTIAFAEELLRSAGEDPAQAKEKLDSGAALEAFRIMIDAQGGEVGVVDHPEQHLAKAEQKSPLAAPRSGFVQSINALAVGQACVRLGAGRARAADLIDPAVGLEVLSHLGARVEAGEPLALIHHNAPISPAAKTLLDQAWVISDEPGPTQPLLIARVQEESVEWLEEPAQA